MPMSFVLLIAVSILLFISFFSVKKRLHTYEYVFVLLIMEFLITSYTAVFYVNGKYFVVSKELPEFFTYKVVQLIIVPFIILWSLELIMRLNVRFIRFIMIVSSISLLFFIDQTLVHLGIIEYRNWKPVWSIITWISFILLACASQRFFRVLLVKEGEIQ